MILARQSNAWRAAGRNIRGRLGFTIIELLVAITILVLIMILLTRVLDGAQRIYRRVSSDIGEVREARRAFTSVSRSLSGATLNTYWDYVDQSGNTRGKATGRFIPERYVRFSELRFKMDSASRLFTRAPHGGTLAGMAVVFQTSLGITRDAGARPLSGALNTVAFYLERCRDPQRPGVFDATSGDSAAGAERWRLFQMTEPMENLTVYGVTSGDPMKETGNTFFSPAASTTLHDKLADNIVGLAFIAEYPDAAGGVKRSYVYDSTPFTAPEKKTQELNENNLPSAIQIVMVALDEVSAQRVERENIDLGVANLFASTPPDPEADLGVLAEKLNAHQLSYRIFSTLIRPGSTQFTVK